MRFHITSNQHTILRKKTGITFLDGVRPVAFILFFLTALLWNGTAFGQCFTCDNIIDVAGASASGNVSAGCVPNPAGANFGCQGYRIDATTTPSIVPGATIYYSTGNGGACSTGGMTSVFVEIDGSCSPGEVSTSGNYTGSFVIPNSASEIIIYVCRDNGGGNPNICNITLCGIDPDVTSVTDETCTGANDGTITAVGVVQGAPLLGTMTFSIDGVGGATANTTGVFTGLAPGNYTIVAYDSGNTNCVGTMDVVVGASATPCCTPSVSCQNLPNVDTEGCAGDVPAAEIDEDNIFTYEACGATVTMSHSDVGDTDFCTDGDGVNFMRTYTLYFDGVPQTPTCSQTIEVYDTTDPQISDVPNYTLQGCNADWPEAVGTTWTDNCSNGGYIFASAGPVQNNGCSEWRVYTFTILDGCGNDDTETTIVSRVVDVTDPNIVDIPNYALQGCNPAWPTLTTTWTDGCSGGGNVTATAGTVTTNGCTQSRVYTFVVADGCGNSDTESTTVTRTYDLTKPNFTTVPANVTVQCNNVPGVGTPVATDFCSTPTIVYNGETRVNGNCANAYTLTRQWTATDGCGNTRTATQRITVVDNGKPTLTVPPNTTITCTDPLPGVGAPTATDGCGGNVAIVYLGQSTMNATCPGTYQIRRTWKATDVCGNSTVATQTIQVLDNQPPVFSASPANVTIQCHQSLPPLVNPTATDACGGYVQITYLGQVRTNGNCLYNYTLTRSWRATDLCGNSTIKVQVITVQDTQPPTFTNPPANLTVVCAPDCVPFPVTPNATDNCGSATVSMVESQSSGDCSTGYTVTRTWTATDQCGNPTVHVQTITVLPALPFAPNEPDANGAPQVVENRQQGDRLDTQNPKLKTVNLLPNPTTDWVTIGLHDFAGEMAVVSIHNELGQLLWEKRFEIVEEAVQRVNLRQAGAPSGLYTVSVRSGGQVYSKRLILMD